MIISILRKLNPFRGKQRLARFLLKTKLQTFRDEIVLGKYGCSYLIPNIVENVGFDIYVDGVFENETIRLILRKLPEGGVWLDVGANIGAICMPVSKQRPDTTALCIEASPRIFKYLITNCKYNALENVILVNKAVADKNDQSVQFFSPIEKFGKGSLSSVFTQDAEMVETITLDSLLEQHGIQKVDFIKVDVEGYEYHTFKGAEKLLSAPNAPDILFEFIDWAEKAAGGLSAGDAQQILISYGYSLFIFSHNGSILPLHSFMTSGNALIYASKKTLI